MNPKQILADLETTIGDIGKHFSKIKEDNEGTRAMLVELAQRSAHMPVQSGVAGSAAILAALEAKTELKSMKDEKGTITISVPHSAIDTRTVRAAAIIGPVSPGDGALQDPDRSSGLVGPAQRRMTIRGLLPSTPTNAGATSFTQLSTWTSAAAVQGNSSSPEAREGEIIGEAGMAFTLETAPVVTIGHWLPASIQILDDISALGQFINTWLTYGLALEEEDELLNGAGGNSHVEGLITAAAAYSRGATNDTRADTLRKAVTQLMLSEHICGGFVLNPVDSEQLDLLKDSQNRYLAVRVGDRVWNIPVIDTNSITVGRWLALDPSCALVRPRREVTIEISNSHSDYFTRMLVAIRAYMREALEIHRPLGLVYGSF